jgi:hypothetical protein
MKKYLYILIILASCTGSDPVIESNPAAEGFNLEGSDQKAIQIADEVMLAMGGRSNWDNTRYISWNFFGARELIWDKYTGDVRINSFRDSTIYIININDETGQVKRDGIAMDDPDSLSKYVDRGKRIWINDSYWLVMPFKLKDSGVTLKWNREDTTMSGIQSNVIQLGFENVGVTPDNRYEVWVDKESNLVRQWAYYRYDTTKVPGFVRPWDDWEKKGNLLLSGNRGDRSLTDIKVMESVPEHTFSSFENVILPTNE